MTGREHTWNMMFKLFAFPDLQRIDPKKQQDIPKK